VLVAAEFSLVAVDRTQIDLLAEAGDRRATVVARLLRRLSISLPAVQLGVTVCAVLLGFLAEPSVARLLHAPIGRLVGEARVDTVALVVALVAVTIVQMVVGELIPKAVAVGRPVEVARLLAPLIRLYGIVMSPLVAVFNGAANALLGLVGIEVQEELSAVRSRHELERLVETSGAEGSLHPEEVRLLTRTFRFQEKTAGEILTPRTDLVALAADSTATDLVERSTVSGFSRFVVYGTGLDDIVGVCHVKSVLDIDPDERDTVTVEEFATPPVVVPESKPLPELMAEMRSTGSYLVVVADEYGGTAGIVTLEDVLEEIVGEIDDEHDLSPTAPPRVRRWGVTWVLEGGLHLDEVQDACGLELPDGEYETLAGFVLDRLGRIPEAGDRFLLDGWQVVVVEMDRHRVATVRLTAPTVRPVGRERS